MLIACCITLSHWYLHESQIVLRAYANGKVRESLSLQMPQMSQSINSLAIAIYIKLLYSAYKGQPNDFVFTMLGCLLPKLVQVSMLNIAEVACSAWVYGSIRINSMVKLSNFVETRDSKLKKNHLNVVCILITVLPLIVAVSVILMDLVYSL